MTKKDIIKILIFTSFFLISMVFKTSSAILDGSILNSNRIGLKDVKITILTPEYEVVGEKYTDPNGNFTFIIKPGKYSIITRNRDNRTQDFIIIHPKGNKPYIKKYTVSILNYIKNWSTYLINALLAIVSGVITALSILFYQKHKSRKLFILTLYKPLQEYSTEIESYVTSYQKKSFTEIGDHLNSICKKLHLKLKNAKKLINEAQELFGNDFMINFPILYATLLKVIKKLDEIILFTENEDWIFEEKTKSAIIVQISELQNLVKLFNI